MGWSVPSSVMWAEAALIGSSGGLSSISEARDARVVPMMLHRLFSTWGKGLGQSKGQGQGQGPVLDLGPVPELWPR